MLPVSFTLWRKVITTNVCKKVNAMGGMPGAAVAAPRARRNTGTDEEAEGLFGAYGNDDVEGTGQHMTGSSAMSNAPRPPPSIDPNFAVYSDEPAYNEPPPQQQQQNDEEYEYYDEEEEEEVPDYI